MSDEVIGAQVAPPETPAQVVTQPEMTLEQALAAIKDLRKEAANYRTKAKELDGLKDAAEAAKLSEVERERKGREQAEAEARQWQARVVNDRLTQAAHKLGIVDPEVAVSLIHDKLEFGDDGLPKNSDEQLRALLKAKPYLAATQVVTSVTNGAGGIAGGERRFTSREISDPDFYAKHKQAIYLAIREGRID